MKCPSCKKENAAGSKFCKFCGSPINGRFKTCPNGHNYDENLEECPYCPKDNFLSDSLSSTVLDESRSFEQKPTQSSDRTLIDTTGPILRAPETFSAVPDKTVIFSDKRQASTPGPEGGRKLVAWLVSYDINPDGTDFRLYEGRTRIGRKSTNDIILNQAGISDEHALMLYRDGKFLIQDNLSTNGTLINGISIEEKTVLKNDDIIKIGNVELKLKVI